MCIAHRVFQLNPPCRVGEIIFDDEIPFGDEIRLDGGRVDLISSAKQISSGPGPDFIKHCLISFYTFISPAKEDPPMNKLTKETDAILLERFGGDSIIALATAADNVPYVRSVDAFYEDGSFYVLTHGLSGKMQQIARNPAVSVAGEWFTAQGHGIDLGYFGKAENAPIARKMRQVFSAWIDNGHNNFEDPNTCILRIRLTRGVLFADGTRHEIDFT